MLAEVAEGLSAPQKELSPEVLLRPARLRAVRGDHPASGVLPDPHRARRCSTAGCRRSSAELGTRALVELGAGSAEKSRIILDAMRAAGTAERYVPIDVSATLPEPDRRAAPAGVSRPRGRARGRGHLGGARTSRAGLPHPALFAFLGSTIGNFYPPAAIRLLEPGARRHGAGRPVPHGRRPAQGRRAGSRRPTTTPGRHRRVQPQHAAGAQPRAGRRLRSRGVRAPGVLRARWRTGSRCISCRRWTQQVTRSRASGASPSPTASRSAPRSAASTTARASPQLFEAAGLRDRGLADRSGSAVRAGRWGRRHEPRSRAPRSRPTSRSTSSRRRSRGSLTPRRVGAEVELIPVEALTGRRMSAGDRGRVATLPFLRRYGGTTGLERRPAPPRARRASTLPAGGTLTFEPGGQLEYSSPACRSASALLALLRSVVLPLRAAAAGEGIDLLAVGIDPLQPRRAGAAAAPRTALRANGRISRPPADPPERG